MPKGATTVCIALLRGVNVGKAKRIEMAELRALVESLGHTRARTLLNSGNIVFAAERRPDVAHIATAIGQAITERFGFSAGVTVLTAATLDAVVAGNPLPQAADDPARFLVAFGADSAARAKAKPLAAQDWSPEALGLTEHAAYLWCAQGILESTLAPAFGRATGNTTTARNWSTVLKLQAAAAAIADAG